LTVATVAAEAAAAASQAQQPVPAIGNLTAREAEVLRLLVAGRSDQEIAETLFISRRTASKHVSNILAKLEVPTRSEAALVAVRTGFP
jgi:DNA-binding CsgD family transcriptional regulator